eukprot:5628421-Prymnesium_polylepis.2
MGRRVTNALQELPTGAPVSIVAPLWLETAALAKGMRAIGDRHVARRPCKLDDALASLAGQLALSRADLPLEICAL